MTIRNTYLTIFKLKSKLYSSYTPLHLWANQKARDAGLENAFGLLDPDERTFEGNSLIPDPGAVCPGCCANCSSKKETPLDALAKVSLTVTLRAS